MDYKEYIMELNRKTPFHRYLGMDIFYLDKGICKAKLVVEKKHTNPINVAHGGVAFSILDLSIGNAARTLGYEVATIEMNINYLHPSKEGDTIIAEGNILKAGKKIIVGEGRLYIDDILIAIARQSLMNLGNLDFSSY